MKLLGSTKSKISKIENGENVHHLEITEVVLPHCIIVNNDYQQNSTVLCPFTLKIIWSIIRYFTKKKKVFKNV